MWNEVFRSNCFAYINISLYVLKECNDNDTVLVSQVASMVGDNKKQLRPESITLQINFQVYKYKINIE